MYRRSYQSMDRYLNPCSERFRMSIRSEIYVDKTLLIAQVNRRIRTEQKYICLRPAPVRKIHGSRYAGSILRKILKQQPHRIGLISYVYR